MVPFAGGVVSIAASLLAVASGPGLVAATSLYLGSRKDENGINEIERQMLQDEHPAAKLYDLIASGRFSAAWNSNEPCQTGFGRAADYVCGKTYVPLKFFYQIAADTLSRSSRIGKRMLSSQPLDCSSKRYILNSNINMSFDAEMNNSKCVRHDPQIYQARVWFEGSAIKKICNIFQCARDRYSLLQELIPCDTAPKINRTFSTFLCYGDSLSFRYFDGNEIRTGMCVAYRSKEFLYGNIIKYSILCKRFYINANKMRSFLLVRLVQKNCLQMFGLELRLGSQELLELYLPFTRHAEKKMMICSLSSLSAMWQFLLQHWQDQAGYTMR